MKLALTLAAVLSLVTFSASANMLTNGGFETGDASSWNNVSGWTAAGTSAKDGSFGAVSAGDIGSDELLMQSATLVAGQEYSLKGFYRIDVAKSAATEGWRNFLLGFFDHPTWGSPQNQAVMTLSGAAVTDWTAFEVKYTPTEAQVGMGLGVGAKQGKMDCVVSVDSLSLTAVPEPATMSVLALGALSLIRRRR